MPGTYPVRPPDRLPTSTLGRAAPAFPARPRIPVPRFGRPPTAHPADTALPEDTVTYVDRDLHCVDCGVVFIHSAADQEYYAQKGFVSDVKLAGFYLRNGGPRVVVEKIGRRLGRSR